MTRQDIAKDLRTVTGDQAFITASQLTKALGRVDPYKVKKEYLMELEHVDGRYLISEVAAALKKKARI